MNTKYDNQNTCLRGNHADRHRCWTLIRFIVAVILLVAAGLKAHQLATMPSLNDGILHAHWFNIFIVEFELFFGVWLIFGMFPRLTWIASVSLFLIFGVVSCYKAISGESSCGCFGNVTVNPWITTVFDISVVGLLGIFRPVNTDFRFQDVIDELLSSVLRLRKLVWVILTWFVIVAPITYVMMSVDKKNLGDLGVEVVAQNGKKTIILEPENWVDKDFLLIPYFEQSNKFDYLKNGRWVIVLYRHNCSKCKQVMTELTEKKVPNVLCVEVPPFGEIEIYSKLFRQAKLNRSRNWFIETPTTIYLQNGKVVL